MLTIVNSSGNTLRVKKKTIRLNRYRIISPLSSGQQSKNATYCESFIVKDKRLGAQCVMHRFHSREDASPATQIQHGLRLNLPYVPRLIDSFSDDNNVQCIIREYIAGVPISQYLSENDALSGKEAIRLVIDLCALLELYAEQKPKPMALAKIDPHSLIRDNDGAIWIVNVSAITPLNNAIAQRQIYGLGKLLTDLLNAGKPQNPLPEALLTVLDHSANSNHDLRYATLTWFRNALVQCLETFSAIDVPYDQLPQPEIHRVKLSQSEVGHAIQQGAINQLQWSKLADIASTIALTESSGELIALDTLDVVRYKHQVESVMRVVNSAEMSAGAILADEVGLGKTIEALMILQEMRARGLAESVLIVTTVPGAAQWLTETRFRIRRSAFERAFRIYDSTSDAGYPLLIIPASVLKQERHLNRLKELRYDLVIVDEAHQCSNSDGQLSAIGIAVDQLRRRRLILLTATPLGNKLWDLFSLVDMIRPGMLGSRSKFAEDYLGSLSSTQKTMAQRTFWAVARSIMIRHKRSALHDVVSPKVEQIAKILPECEPKKEIANKVTVSCEIICSRWVNNRVVVFSRLKSARAMLVEAIRRASPTRPVIEFVGGRQEGREMENRFNDYPDAVIVSGDTIAEGMNWQMADRMLHFDTPLSPQIWEQRVGRIYRLGQKSQQIEIMHLAHVGTSDEKLLLFYQEDFGLFKLPIGESASLLDHVIAPEFRDIESFTRELIRSNNLTNSQRFEELRAAIKVARQNYERSLNESEILDQLYFGELGQ